MAFTSDQLFNWGLCATGDTNVNILIKFIESIFTGRDGHMFTKVAFTTISVYWVLCTWIAKCNTIIVCIVNGVLLIFCISSNLGYAYIILSNGAYFTLYSADWFFLQFFSYYITVHDKKCSIFNKFRSKIKTINSTVTEYHSTFLIGGYDK